MYDDYNSERGHLWFITAIFFFFYISILHKSFWKGTCNYCWQIFPHDSVNKIKTKIERDNQQHYQIKQTKTCEADLGSGKKCFCPEIKSLCLDWFSGFCCFSIIQTSATNIPAATVACRHTPLSTQTEFITSSAGVRVSAHVSDPESCQTGYM